MERVVGIVVLGTWSVLAWQFSCAAMALHTWAKAGATVTAVGSASIRWSIKVPMRDGVRLNATVYIAQNRDTPGPCILTLTPYIADFIHTQATYFAAHGYHFVVVDSRGRGDSEGSFYPFLQEAQDGYDTVEWLAKQPYCNGKVAMWGSSYMGSAQWAAAKELPPHLATIVPAAAAYVGLDFPMRNNIFYPYSIQWLVLTSGHPAQWQTFSDSSFWTAFHRRWHESGRPFRDLDQMLGISSGIFQEWLSHPELGPYWDAYNPTAAQLARLQIPILTVTGSYDDDQPGALEHYKQFMRFASPEARAHHYLIIGPWDHGGTVSPRLEVGGVKFGPASLLDLQELELQWYEWTMDHKPKPDFLKKQVAYYVMGAEHWRYADTLEAATATSRPFFLDSRSGASDVFSSGGLGGATGKGEPDQFRYAPGDSSGREVEAESQRDAGSLTDQTVLTALNGRELVYHTAPFEQPMEITGFFKLKAWISLDRPDTDLYVSVYEITPDGNSIRLSTDAMRARYREGFRSPKLVATDRALPYQFEHFTFVSRKIKAGSRLRLVIAPMGQLVEATFAEKNYNIGGVVAEETAQQSKQVTVRLFHDSGHPSALYVPIGQTEEAKH